MRNKKILAFCSIVILSATSLFAYSDEELQNMLALNNVALNKAQEDADLATLDLKDAKASFQPTVELSTTATYMQNPPIGKITIDTDDIVTGITGVSGMGIGPYTIYGGMENTLYNFDIKITQPVFTWGKLTTAEKIYENVELVRNLKATSLKKQLASELRAREIGIYYIKEMAKNLDKQNTAAKKLLDISKDARDNGILTNQDVLDAEIQAKQVEVGMKKLNMELNNQISAIRTLCGNQNITASDIELVPDEDEMTEIVNSDWNELLARALSPTGETFSMLNLLKTVSNQTKYVADNSMYWKPDVGLQVELGYYGAYLPVLQQGWYTKDNYQLNVTLALSDTLWDGGKALNDVARKEINQEAASLDYQDAREQIISKLNEALLQMDYSTSNIEYKDLSASVAGEKVKENQSKHDEGYGDEKDILLAKIEQYGYELDALKERVTRASNYFTVRYLIGE
jgi:outer membrane protein TolC